MSTLIFKFVMTDEGRQQVFVKTGLMPPLTDVAEYDMTQATAEQRSALIGQVKIDSRNDNIELDWAYSNRPAFPAAPDLATLAEAVQTHVQQQDEKRIVELVEKIKRYASKLAQSIEARETALYCYLERHEVDDAKRLNVPTEPYDVVLAEYNQLLPEFKAEAAERKERSRIMEAEAVAQREARKAALQAMKTDWIEQYGSAHLKRACLAEGYNCQRLYVTERAAREAPGFVVDFNNNAGWKDRSCPSVEALDGLDEARKLTLGEPIIVWLTDAPNARVNTYDYDEFAACEAVVIRNYLDQYDLIKVL